MDNTIWITKGEGLLKKVEENTYSNEDFVSAVYEDSTPIGHYMQSQFPSPVTVKTPPGVIPTSWSCWESSKVVVDDVIKNIDLPGEINYDDRLWVTKSKQSDRIRHIMNNANFVVSPRGIKDQGIPHSVNETIASVIYVLYYLLEKNTTAFIKSKDKLNISANKKNAICNAHKIFQGHEDVTSVILGSMYVEPSPTVIKRIYALKSVIGSYAVDAMLNDIYLKVCHEQVEEIDKLYNMLIDKGVVRD